MEGFGSDTLLGNTVSCSVLSMIAVTRDHPQGLPRDHPRGSRVEPRLM